jgi:hypothetical protein
MTDYNDVEGRADDDNESSTTSRHDILAIIDRFIEQILKIRKTLFGVSISALVLAPIAIGLSVFLLRHPSFFAILEVESEFGLVLSILLGAVIIISSIWLIAGIRQYRSICSWNKRYNDFVREKEEIDKKIALQYGLDNNPSE